MMRMNRKNRIIGQFIVLLLAVGVAGWWVYEIRKEIPPMSRATLPEAVVEAVEVPPAELKDRLRSTLQVVDRLPEKGVRLAEVDATLVLTPEEASPGGLAESGRGPEYVQPSLSLLFFNHQRFAVLDGKPYQEGGVLDDGRVIRGIDYEGVTLEWPVAQSMTDELTGRLERVPWIPPMRVELKQPVSQRAAPVAEESDQSAIPELPQVE